MCLSITRQPGGCRGDVVCPAATRGQVVTVGGVLGADDGGVREDRCHAKVGPLRVDVLLKAYVYVLGGCPILHKLFWCIGFSFFCCYSSQQLIYLSTTIKFKVFSRLLYKIQGFQGLEFGPIKFKAFQDPIRTLLSNN